MGSKKRDLEIIYKLQWKSKPGNGDDKASVVGLYDTPSTTLKWEFFKKYLLRNSGATGNDVKVSYVSNEAEVPIETEKDFQLAMYTFRNKARNGEIIDLILDRISCASQWKDFNIRDFHTESNSKCGRCCNEEPPSWFKKYMKQMKSEITQEVTESVVNAIGHLKVQNPTQPACHHVRKSKSETKRRNKAAAWLMSEAGNEKEILKSLKLEHKLENKLEKLERKTMKIKEKFARSSDSDAGHVPAKRCSVILVPKDEDQGMNAVTVDRFQPLVLPHLMGGEKYMQTWEVMNVGTEAWTEDTEIRYAWGSKPLLPAKKSVPCPKLNPGEKGPICVLLEVPKTPGPYECHWYFYHNGRRFGCSLDCHLLVDPSPAQLMSSPNKPQEVMPNFLFEPLNKTEEVLRQTSEIEKVNGSLEKLSMNDLSDDKLYSSDSDNQSIISIADSNTSAKSGTGSEFVVVSDVETDEKKEEKKEDNNNNTDVNAPKECNIKDVPLDLSQNVSSEVVESVQLEMPVKEERPVDVSGFAYVMLNGKKVAVPKKFLHKDYLATAEDAPDPTIPTQLPIETAEAAIEHLPCVFEHFPRTVDNSPCIVESACAKPTFQEILDKSVEQLQQSEEEELAKVAIEEGMKVDSEGRLFVFPQTYPGFEVVHPQVEEPAMDLSSMNAQEQAYVRGMTSSCYNYASSSSAGAKYNPYGPLDDDKRGDFFTVVEYPNLSMEMIDPLTHEVQEPQLVEQDPEQIRVSPNGKMVMNTQTNTDAVHAVLPESIVSGAVHVASSALNTARSVLSMFANQKPQEENKLLNGRWVTSHPESKQELNLRLLEEMGFPNREHNEILLCRYDGNIERVIYELLSS